MAAAYSGLTTAQPVAMWSTRPGLAYTFREHIVELVRQVRQEPGCLTPGSLIQLNEIPALGTDQAG
jgi:hypothetical protein